MQIIIDIDESLYNTVNDSSVDSGYCANECYNAVRCGTPLPKEHGHIIDKVKEFKKEVENKYDDFANSWDDRVEGRNEMICEVLDMIDELIESEGGE